MLEVLQPDPELTEDQTTLASKLRKVIQMKLMRLFYQIQETNGEK
jgi:hypothetical protein